MERSCFLKQISVILIRSSTEIFFFSRLSSAFLKTSRPASWGILVYRPMTSTVTIIASCGIWSVLFGFIIKLLESFTNGEPSCITDLCSLSKNSDVFAVGVPQFQINELPELHEAFENLGQQMQLAQVGYIYN